MNVERQAGLEWWQLLELRLIRANVANRKIIMIFIHLSTVEFLYSPTSPPWSQVTFLESLNSSLVLIESMRWTESVAHLHSRPSLGPGSPQGAGQCLASPQLRHVAQSDQPSGLHRGCHHSRVLDPGDGSRRAGSSLTPLDPQGRKQERAAFYTDFLLHFIEQGWETSGKSGIPKSYREA